MLPKEDRRAMLLRIFNEDVPLVNTTQKREAETGTSTPAIETPAEAETAEATINAQVTHPEEVALKYENEVIGEGEQEQTDSRETWTKAAGEEDRFNTTV